jgi:hypothetical protein
MMVFKRSIAVACLSAATFPAWASDINQIQTLTQDEFHALSEDLGAALSYKPLTPAAPLGVLGFDMGVAVTATKLQNSAVFAKAGGGDHSTVAVPMLRLNLGLPLDIDVGAMYGAVPGTNIRLAGGELRYAIVSGGTAVPAIGLRGSYTKLTGVDQLEFDTKGVDLSISKGFAGISPYAGVGKVWVASTPVGMPAGTPVKESFSLNKAFVGVNFNFLAVNIALEGDRTGSATSYGAKVGLRF